MNRFVVILFSLALLSAGNVMAQEVVPDSLQVSAVADSLLVPAAADTLAVGDSLSDDELLKMLSAPQNDTVKKVVDRGFDVSSMIRSRRMRAADVTPFEAWPFMKNTFGSLRLTSLTMSSDDYSSGLQLGVSFGKWLLPDHAVRANLDMGLWHDNFDGEPILGTELSASYIFNLTSYAFGYRTNRLFEASVLAGLGYANSTLVKNVANQTSGVSGSALTAHVGALLNLRIFKNLDFFLEPQAVMYTKGMAVSNSGTWRSWVTAFRGTLGFTYNINQAYTEDSPLLRERSDGYFISFMMGPAMQNSRLVYQDVGFVDALGVHVGLSVGKYYTDYFALRYTGSYTRNTWVAYPDGLSFPCNYYALRVEGMFDVLDFVYHCLPDNFKKPGFLAASVIFGPEMGYMYKVDRNDVLKTLYMGMTVGAQAKFRLGKRLALFVEPRFSIIPYDAPIHLPTTLHDRDNYWDGVMNLNAGIEFAL